MKKLLILAISLSAILASCSKDDDNLLDDINGNDINSAPVAVDDLAQIEAGSSKIIEVLDNDIDSDGMTIASFGSVDNFTISAVGNTALKVEVASACAAGDYSFYYVAQDPYGAEDTATVNVTVKASAPSYENFFKYGETSYTPATKTWMQGQVFGWDEAFTKSHASQSDYYSVTIHISSAFDYREKGKTFELTTVDTDGNIPENSIYIEFSSVKNYSSDNDVVEAGQKVKMTVTETTATGIHAYFEIEDATTSNNETLTVKTTI